MWGGLEYGPGDVTSGLIDLCRVWIRPEHIMAEVGCFRGVSTCIFALFAGWVHAVDGWEWSADMGYQDISREALVEARGEFLKAVAKYHNVESWRGLSVWTARNFLPAFLDAVYLDADHSAPSFLEDVRAWLPRIKPTGLLMGHDWSCVQQHWEELRLPQPVAVYSEDSWVVKVEDIRA